MGDKYKRREAKRRKKLKEKLLRGNRRIFLRQLLSVNRYHKAGTLKDGE